MMVSADQNLQTEGFVQARTHEILSGEGANPGYFFQARFYATFLKK